MKFSLFYQRYRGYFYITVAATFWGVSGTIAKFLFNRAFSPLTLVQMRSTLSFLVFLPVLFFVRRSPWTIRKGIVFASLGIVGVAGANYFYYLAISKSTVATAILLQYTAPVLVMFYMILTGEEQISLSKIIALVASLAGCFLAVGGGTFRAFALSPQGIILGIFSAFCFAFLTIFGRKVSLGDTVWEGLIYTLGFASFFWMTIQSPVKIYQAHYTIEDWQYFFIFAMISVLIPYVFYFKGLREIQASRAIITSTFEPIVAILSAFLIVNETLNLTQSLGALLVVGSIVILQVNPEVLTNGKT